MKSNQTEYLALGLAAVAVLLIVKTQKEPQATASAPASSAQQPAGYSAAGRVSNGPGIFTNLWDKDWTNDYATQASYTPQSMAADPFGLDNNPSNDQAPAMSFAPWYKSERAPWQ